MSLTINQVVYLIIGIVVLVVIIFLFIYYGVGPFKEFMVECDPIKVKYCCEEYRSELQECFARFKCKGPETCP